MRLNSFVYFKKYFIVIIEKKKEKATEVKFKTDKFILSDNIIFLSPKIVIAPKVGIDSKKDILAESYLSNFKNLAAVIVTPDLLTPGINDIT